MITISWGGEGGILLVSNLTNGLKPNKKNGCSKKSAELFCVRSNSSQHIGNKKLNFKIFIRCRQAEIKTYHEL